MRTTATIAFLSTLRRGRPRRRAGVPAAAREDRRGPRAADRAANDGCGGSLPAQVTKIYTCQLNQADPFDNLTQLQRQSG